MLRHRFFIHLSKLKIMYSLDCSYYNFKFKTMDELFHHILSSGMDPNYEITFNSHKTGEFASDLIDYYAM